MSKVSHFEILTDRNREIREKIIRYVSDLQHLAGLLDTHIEIEERRKGVLDPARSDYPVAALRLRARRDNLTATISDLEKTLAADPTRDARPAKSLH
jgi:hypothetical protein